MYACLRIRCVFVCVFVRAVQKVGYDYDEEEIDRRKWATEHRYETEDVD